MRVSDKAIERLRAAAEVPDLTGTRYCLLSKLGQGGMGTVYCVEDSALQRQVALKVISVPENREELAARLLQEARVIAGLEHPGMVPVHDVGTLADGRVFYTMKLVQGERLDAVDSVGSRVQRLQIVQKICDAVAFAHARGIIHRDLKPSNVMIGPFGEVLVMDWGLARILSDAAADSNARLTSQPTALGTPGFTAPELILGQDSGPRADIFSLGVILNFMLSRETNEPIPRRLKSIVEKASAKQPSDRYESVQQMAEDIAQYLQGGPVSAYPENAAERAWRWMVRNRSWILLILAYLLMRTLFVLWRKYF